MSTVRYRDDESDSATSVITVLLGAAAGFAVGMYLAQRLGGFGGLASRLRKRDIEAEDDAALYEAAGDGFGSDEYAIAGDLDIDDHEDVDDFDGVEAEGDDADDEADDFDDDEDEIAESGDDDAAPILEKRVLEAFTNDPVLSERAIDIGATEDGEIELEGWVDDDSEAELAVTIARGVPGVRAVSNHLMVDD